MRHNKYEKYLQIPKRLYTHDLFHSLTLCFSESDFWNIRDQEKTIHVPYDDLKHSRISQNFVLKLEDV